MSHGDSMAFTVDERERIRLSLLEAGRDAFGTFGLKRTRIEDIARSSGIAKGSFYLFFDSKEELCFTLLEEEEKLRDRELERAGISVDGPEALARLLQGAFDAFEESRVAMRLHALDEFPLLIRKIPPERIAAHQENDSVRMRTLLRRLIERGFPVTCNPVVLSGLFRALFMLSFHRREIGEEIFPEVRRLLLESVARGLWAGRNAV
jgi:AcrR family transcriptional regulator